MALDFPPAPSVGDFFPPPPASPRWQFNGTSWVSAPAVTGLYLPIAGGTMTGPGNLTVNGLTTLNGVTVVDNDATVTGDFDVSGTTVLDGVTADSIVLTTAPTQNMQVANKQYVDEEVAAGGLWKGTWDAENNVPDLTAAALQVNAWGWTVTTSDHTTPFTIPATPVIPGLNGLTVYDGDHVIWSDSASEYEVVHGSSLSLSEAEDMFPAKIDAIIRGVPGTYTQGTDFTDFQTFLDANVNNRFFDAALTVVLDTANTNPVFIYNVSFTREALFTINTSAQMATVLTVENVISGTNIFINSTAPTTYTSATFNGCIPKFGGTTTFGSTTLRGMNDASLGNVVADNITFTNLVLGGNASAIASVNCPLTINALAVHGVLMIAAGATQLTLPASITGFGQVIDNRTIVGRRDTFARTTLVNRAITVDIADLQATINSLPKILSGTISITVNPGTITTAIRVADFTGPGLFGIYGANSATNTHNVLSLSVENCTLARFTIRGFNATTSNSTGFLVRNCIGSFNYIYMCTATGGVPSDTANVGFYNEESSFTYFSGCVASNKQIGIRGRSGTWRTTVCTGTNNAYGCGVYTGILLDQNAANGLTGNTNKYAIGEGGMVIDVTGTIFTQKGQVN